ncbi:MAG: type II toxin-antitoxin system VapC family toxin [Gammaproteobacteria bacterium]|nr:type II toxin-antitoxin system VapC family toxin [Gammaproteobacteria bacterium]
MKGFLDTSSLVKLYHREPGMETLIATLSSGFESLYLSELADNCYGVFCVRREHMYIVFHHNLRNDAEYAELPALTERLEAG